MGTETAISWCDHTFNTHEGCEKISPGCKHCYAAEMARHPVRGHAMTVERITKKQAVRAVRAKLPILGQKKLQEQLEYAVGGCCSRCSDARVLAEAFRMGASAAQSVIAARIAAIKTKEPKQP